MIIDIVVPEHGVDLQMLEDIISSARGVIQKILRTRTISWKRNSEAGVVHIWWEADAPQGDVSIYKDFMQAVCSYSVKRTLRHGSDYVSDVYNEKFYAKNLFARLGWGGSEHRFDRRILTRPLKGTANIYYKKKKR